MLGDKARFRNRVSAVFMKANAAAQRISVDVRGWDRLLLLAEGVPSWAWGHAIWADPVLIDKDGKRISLEGQLEMSFVEAYHSFPTPAVMS